MSDNITNELGKLFEKLESVAKESKLEEKKKIDYVETTQSDLSNLFSELEKVSQETKTSNEDSKDKLNEFASLFENISQQKEDYPDDLPSDVEPAPEDDPTDDVTSDVGEWIKKDVDKNDKKVKAIEELFASLLPNDLTNSTKLEPIVEEFQEKPIQPKKSKTIKKATISVDEQKFMSKVLNDIEKIPTKEKPVDISEQSFPNSIKDSLLTPDQTSLQRKVAQPEDSLTRLRKEFEQFRTVMQRNLEAKQNAYDGNSGSGAVKIQDMDDVDADGALINGNVFRFNSSKGKFDSVAPVTEAIIQEGTENEKILLDGTDADGTDSGGFISLEDDTFGSVGFDNISEDILPDLTNTRNLGSSTKRFKELFLAGQTIDLGGATISSDGTGTVSISSDGVTLPSNSKVGSDTIAKAGTNGKTSIDVEFFSRAGGTSTANATFKFQSKGLSYVFTDAGTFTLSDGTSLEDSNPELFTF